MDELTFIIKTLERPGCLLRLIQSIYRYYPDAAILVGDDSRESSRETVKKAIRKRFAGRDISVFELLYDCGLSYGRNYLVNQVKTRYFVLLDDDFVFDQQTDIMAGLDILKDTGLDIIGGYFRNYPIVSSVKDWLKYPVRLLLRGVQDYNYIGMIDEQREEIRVKYYTKRFPEYEQTDIVHNFFIAKTEVIRDRCMWDESIKIHEHTPFFIKAKQQGLKVGFTSRMSVIHKPFRPKKYNTFRDRDYIKDWMKLYGFKRFIFSMDDGEEKIIKLD